MGQYYLIVNLTKREFIDPRKLGIGLKAIEQIASFPSTPQALFALLICSNGRGGGDLALHDSSNYGPPGRDWSPKEPVAEYDGNYTRHEFREVIGRWTGDRIAVIGDYAEDADIVPPGYDPASRIYGLCSDEEYLDITDLVRPLLAAELGIEYFTERRALRDADGVLDHWESWHFRRDPNAAFSVLDEDSNDGRVLCPDLVITSKTTQ